MEFIYRAKTKNGEEKTGKINARSEELALQILQSYDFVVVDLKKKKESTFWDRIFYKNVTIKGRDLAIFLRQLSTMLSAKIPLIESLKTLLNQASSPAVRDMIFSLVSSLDSGLTLSQSMGETGVFSKFYIEMVRSGEVSGRLEQVFTYLADYAENEAELDAKARSAAIYPIFILLVFLVVGSVITISIAPQMVDIFQEFDREPPALTLALITIGRFLINWGFLVLLMLVGVFFAAKNYLDSAEGQNIKSFWMMKVPVLGVIYKNIYVSRFAETLSTLLVGGIPIVEALEISGSATGNFVFKNIADELADGIKSGEQINKLMRKYEEYFPPLVNQMVAIGESTGRLSELLKRVAVYYYNQVERGFSVLLELLQPILIVVLGGLVGILIAGVLLPIYQLAQTI